MVLLLQSTGWVVLQICVTITRNRCFGRVPPKSRYSPARSAVWGWGDIQSSYFLVMILNFDLTILRTVVTVLGWKIEGTTTRLVVWLRVHLGQGRAKNSHSQPYILLICTTRFPSIPSFASAFRQNVSLYRRPEICFCNRIAPYEVLKCMKGWQYCDSSSAQHSRK